MLSLSGLQPHPTHTCQKSVTEICRSVTAPGSLLLLPYESGFWFRFKAQHPHMPMQAQQTHDADDVEIPTSTPEGRRYAQISNIQDQDPALIPIELRGMCRQTDRGPDREAKGKWMLNPEDVIASAPIADSFFEGFTERCVDVDDGHVFCRIKGDAPPLALVTRISSDLGHMARGGTTVGRILPGDLRGSTRLWAIVETRKLRSAPDLFEERDGEGSAWPHESLGARRVSHWCK